MDEEELIQDNLLWDDVESWSFPTLDRGDELDADKKEEEAPPPPPPPKGKKRSAAAARGGDGGESDDHELHIWTERERRKKMRNMFANLHALLPHIPPKADKSTIVDEAVKFIKKLQQSHEELQRRKLERAGGMVTREAFIAEQGSSSPNSGPEYPAIFKTWTSPNVILNICGRDGHLSVCTIKKPGLLSAICFVMEKHSLDLVSAHLSSHRHTCIYMIHIRANLGSNQFLQAFPVEEIFKQAAAEIMLWVNS